jgi:quercetin dioxygenase-like cupin family protein
MTYAAGIIKPEAESQARAKAVNTIRYAAGWQLEVTYPPAALAPIHRHPVAGIVYIVGGTAESAYGSDASRQFKRGETLQDRVDLPTHIS